MLFCIFCLNAVNGGWGKWSEWSQCSVTCEKGTKSRHRFCNNPAPDNGGLDCPGNATDHTICTMDKCRGELYISDRHLEKCLLYFVYNTYLNICFCSLWKYNSN